MEKETKYFFNRKSKYSKYSEIVLNTSFDIKKNLGSQSGTIRLFDKEFIACAVKNSLDKHFNKLLELILKIEEDDDDPPSSLIFCLNEADKLRKELINKFTRFLDKKEKALLEKKLEIIEKDIKTKLISYRLNMMAFNNIRYNDNHYENDFVEEHHRRR